MWAEGSIKVSNNIFHYWVKHFEEPSEDYGMDGGRISKLMLKRDGEITYNYDRGLIFLRRQEPKMHLPFD